MRKLLTDKQVAERLGIHVQTLRNWRHEDKGLPYIKIGASVRYDADDVEDEIIARKVIPKGD